LCHLNLNDAHYTLAIPNDPVILQAPARPAARCIIAVADSTNGVARPADSP